MKTVYEFFTSNKLGKAYLNYKIVKGRQRFERWLPRECDSTWLSLLSIFTNIPPLSYWDEDLVDQALKLLETNAQRTNEALSLRENEVNNGFDVLIRFSERNYYEDLIELDKPNDLLRLANEIHPDYLLISQHIFSNFLILYWSIKKKGGVDGKFDLPGAIALFTNTGFEEFINGYDDKIRNSIAHGQVFFRGLGIQYGDPKYKYELATFEFLDKFDILWRTSISLAIGIILFFAKQIDDGNKNFPLGIGRLLAASSVERNDFLVKDYLLSDLGGIGKQLHIVIQTSTLSRNTNMLDCINYAIRLTQYTRIDFSRILFDVNYVNKPVSGLLILDWKILNELLRLNVEYDQITRIIITNLLWYNEPIKLSVWKMLFKNVKDDIKYSQLELYETRKIYPPLLLDDCYRIKKITNSSVSGIGRLEIKVVLVNPDYGSDLGLIKKICRRIHNKFSKHWISTEPSKLNSRINIPATPKYIWIYLYKFDGTVRWIGKNGWHGKNLLCVSEFIRGNRQAILIKKPDIIEHKIRYQFSMKY